MGSEAEAMQAGIRFKPNCHRSAHVCGAQEFQLFPAVDGHPKIALTCLRESAANPQRSVTVGVCLDDGKGLRTWSQISG